MKKICFIVSTPLTANAFLLKHFEYLSREFEITLVANYDGKIQDKIPFVTHKKDIKINRNIAIFSDVIALIKLSIYLKQERFNAVHTVTPKAGLIGILASWLSKTPIRIHIFTGQVWHTQTGLKKRLLKFLDTIIVTFSTHILVDGQSQRRFLIANKIIKESNSQVLGKGSISGVDVGRFNPTASVRKKYRAQLGYNETDVVFAFLGRMNTDKGILDLAHAFQQLNVKYPNVRLLLVGFDEENMETQLQTIITSNYFFFGSTSKPEEVLQAADVFCLPSYREGFGTSVIEASLLELPIICSDTYGLAETILENKTGLRHEVKNINQLYNQMELLVTKETTRKVLGKEGRNYVIQNFSAAEVSEQWLRFYKELV